MSAKTKMKDYVSQMFSTKESTSSTDRLISSQISGLAAPSSVAPLLLHSLPIRTQSHRNVYQPTTISVHNSSRYNKVPTEEPNLHGYGQRRNRSSSSRWRSLLRNLKSTMSVDRQLEKNLRHAFEEGTLDAKHPTIQDQDEGNTGESRLGPQVLAALSVSMGSLVVGYASGYTSPASVSMQTDKTIDIDATALDWIGGIMPLSALLGGIAGGPLIDTLGRKTTILATAIPFIISWLFIGLAVNIPLILTGRSIVGFCIGIASLALPVYLGETVQAEVRGTLGLLPTVFGNTGILLVYVGGMFLNWWHLALLGALVPVPFLVFMCIIPETPTWYLGKNKGENAEKALQWLRGKDADIKKEFSEIERSALQNQRGDSSLKSLFSQSSFKPVAITIGLMFFQQLSGINAVIFYATKIFEDTGSTLDENICTIIIGIVNFLAVFLATVLIDRMGRKMLLYISSVTMTVCLGSLGGYMYFKNNGYDVSCYSSLPLVSLVLYIVGFSMGFGPIPWLMMGELLPAKIRGPAASLATAFNWTCTSLVTLFFGQVQNAIGIGHTFLIFSVICFVAFFFVLSAVPETRGVSLEDIERKFQKNVRRMSSIANLRPTPMSV